MNSHSEPLPGSDRAAPAGMSAIGPVEPNELITVSLYLKPSDPDAAPVVGGAPFDHGERRAALRQARTTTHDGDLAQVAAFAQANGLAVAETDPARRLVRLSGTASAMEAAFDTELHRYEANGREHRVRTGQLHLPVPLVARVLAVLGLDTRPVATPKFVRAKATAPGFLPTEVAALYGLGDGDAARECVGIIELGGGYTDADTADAFAAMGLPVPPVVAVAVDGASNAPGGDADGEVALDIQVVGGVARGARLAVYFAPNTNQGFVDAISQAVHDEANRPSAISISWGSPESEWTGQAVAAMSAAFADAVTLGVTVTAASGDSLATDGAKDGKAHVDFPASDPTVLGCGGTRVSARGGRLQDETVWNADGSGTGGGVSALFARPDYQKDAMVPAHHGRRGGRGVPDVAADADPATGYRVVVGGKTGVIGGTSAAAPLWAGVAALLNAGRTQPVGQMHATVYARADACRDVTRGDNKAGAIGFAAGPGWDACTGLDSRTGISFAGRSPNHRPESSLQRRHAAGDATWTGSATPSDVAHARCRRGVHSRPRPSRCPSPRFAGRAEHDRSARQGPAPVRVLGVVLRVERGQLFHARMA